MCLNPYEGQRQWHHSVPFGYREVLGDASRHRKE